MAILDVFVARYSMGGFYNAVGIKCAREWGVNGRLNPIPYVLSIVV